MYVTVEISARHVHISQKDADRLFGKGFMWSIQRPISQKGQFASRETVEVRTKLASLKGVRIVGPVREKTQIELSRSDARQLGIEPNVRISGALKGTPGATIIGPKGIVRLREGVIIPHRHIHASPTDAKRANVRHGSVVSVRVIGERAVTFHKIIVRVHKNYRWRMHIDTDEGNAAGISQVSRGILIPHVGS